MSAVVGVTPLAGEEAIVVVVEIVLHLWGALIASSVGDLDIGLENALQLEAVVGVGYLLALGLAEAVEVEDVGTALEVETAMVTAMWMIGTMEGAMGTETVLTAGTIGMAAVDAIVMAVIVMAAVGIHLLGIATMEAAVEVTDMEGLLTVTLRMDMARKEVMIGIGMVQGVVAVTGTGVVGPYVMRVVAATGTGQHRMIVLLGEGALRPMITDNCVYTWFLINPMKLWNVVSMQPAVMTVYDIL